MLFALCVLEQETAMGHTYIRLIVHTIFSTKQRVPYLSRPQREEVFTYMGGILRGLNCEPLHINGVADHAHMVFRLNPIAPIAEVIQKTKANSSKWIHEKRLLHRTFAWQRGYAAFSVSESSVDHVMRYVANQEAHHRHVSFQDELRGFLRQHRIQYDERYLWD